MSPPLFRGGHGRQSLVALYRLAHARGDQSALEDLAAMVTSRACRLLLRNPRKEVLLLLDCYEAATALGIQGDPLFEASRVILIESAGNVARDLSQVTRAAREGMEKSCS
jgi:hypothetical protein